MVNVKPQESLFCTIAWVVLFCGQRQRFVVASRRRRARFWALGKSKRNRDGIHQFKRHVVAAFCRFIHDEPTNQPTNQRNVDCDSVIAIVTTAAMILCLGCYQEGSHNPLTGKSCRNQNMVLPTASLSYPSVSCSSPIWTFRRRPALVRHFGSFFTSRAEGPHCWWLSFSSSSSSH